MFPYIHQIVYRYKAPHHWQIFHYHCILKSGFGECFMACDASSNLLSLFILALTSPITVTFVTLKRLYSLITQNDSNLKYRVFWGKVYRAIKNSGVELILNHNWSCSMWTSCTKFQRYVIINKATPQCSSPGTAMLYLDTWNLVRRKDRLSWAGKGKQHHKLTYRICFLFLNWSIHIDTDYHQLPFQANVLKSRV